MKSLPRFALALLLTGPLAACATEGSRAALTPAAPSTMAAAVEDELAIEPDRTSSGYFMAGTMAISEGQAQDAAKFFDQAALAADADDRDYLNEQAFTAAVMAGNIERAAQIAPKDPESSAYRLGRLVTAVEALAAGKADQSYAILNDETFGANYRAAAALLRPWAALAKGDVAAATQVVSSTGSNPAQAFSAFNQAMVLESADQPGRAEALYKALAGETPEASFFTLGYGEFLERQNRAREAVTLYDGLLKRRPDDRGIQAARARAAGRRPAPPKPAPRDGAGQAMLIAAMASLSQRDAASGLTYLRLSLRLDPDRTESLLMVGDFLEQAGDGAGARAAFAKVPPASRDYAGAQARIVMSYQRADDDDAALAVARRLVASTPHETGAQILLSEVLRTSKDYEGSVKILNQVIAAEGRKTEWNLFYARAIGLHMSGDWPAAERDLLRALALAPDEPDVQNYLGYSWADRGERLPEALALLEKAAASQPNSGAIIDSLGWAYYRNGEYDKAVENLERAVEMAPSAADINDHLGDVYAKVGRTLEARYQWERVLTLEVEDELKAKVLAKIAATPAPPPIIAASLAPEGIDNASP